MKLKTFKSLRAKISLFFSVPFILVLISCQDKQIEYPVKNLPVSDILPKLKIKFSEGQINSVSSNTKTYQK